ncbi:hypothetical protein K2P56_01650 [Patescibacteria group bacterium]|nr:hypothetical protein [Patescibacteria group bacterium]
MSTESYRVADFSLQSRIDSHEFGKKVASAAFFHIRFNLELMKVYASLWGVASPSKEEKGVVVPISEFASYYERPRRQSS